MKIEQGVDEILRPPFFMVHPLSLSRKDVVLWVYNAMSWEVYFPPVYRQTIDDTKNMGILLVQLSVKPTYKF